LRVISKIIIRIPRSAARNKKSATVSSRFSLRSFFVRIEVNERIQDIVSRTATTEVNSSIIYDSILLAICNDVITKRQNPRRFADVFRICCDVLFAIRQK
jgi:hypothetical protein